MKKNRRNIIIIIILLLISAYLYFSQTKGTIKKELKDFAVEDTSSINKIFLVDKASNKILLERNNNAWLVNKKYVARKSAINLLLKTITSLSVKAPVAHSAFKTIVGNLSARSVKVEIYKNDKLVKTYYVGGQTQDQYGTYMLLENSSQPFIMEIKGFRGYLTPRYFTNELEWRERYLFKSDYDNIASITVKIPKTPEQSFKIISHGDNLYDLKSLNNSNSLVWFDTLLVKKYISSCKNISFSSFAKEIDKNGKDSIALTTPHYIISIKDRKGNINTVTTYFKRESGINDNSGEVFEFDPDFEYAFFNHFDETIIIQYYVFDKLFKTLDFFKPRFYSKH